eukprot:INCI14104.1.p1 GENE.INCI14104.1~~INCI14104.1.p1  ORF type:complete len:409 (-),score=68.17 INCI14104.1:218-1444(-)
MVGSSTGSKSAASAAGAAGRQQQPKNKKSKKNKKRKQGDHVSKPDPGLSLAPLWWFLGLAALVVAWSAVTPWTSSSYEKGHAALVRSQAAIARGEWDAALELIETATRYGVPLDADGLNSHGVCLLKMNRTREAAAQFRRAVDLQPESFDALRNLAHVLRTTDQVDDAALLYGQIVELYDACSVHKSHGKRSSAETDSVQDPNAENNKDNEAQSALAREAARPEVCRAMETSHETKDSFQAAVREALFYGAEILRTELNRTAAAAHHLRRLVKLDPQNPRALLALAEVLLNASEPVSNGQLASPTAATDHLGNLTKGQSKEEQAEDDWSAAASSKYQATTLLRKCAALADRSRNDFHKQVAVLRCQWLLAQLALSEPEPSAPGLAEGRAALRSVVATKQVRGCTAAPC